MNNGEREIEIPIDEVTRVLILATSAAENNEDKQTCRIVADFFDAIGVGPISTTLGENQTMRQVVDGCFSFADVFAKANGADTR